MKAIYVHASRRWAFLKSFDALAAKASWVLKKDSSKAGSMLAMKRIRYQCRITMYQICRSSNIRWKQVNKTGRTQRPVNKGLLKCLSPSTVLGRLMEWRLQRYSWRNLNWIEVYRISTSGSFCVCAKRRLDNRVILLTVSDMTTFSRIYRNATLALILLLCGKFINIRQFLSAFTKNRSIVLHW